MKVLVALISYMTLTAFAQYNPIPVPMPVPTPIPQEAFCTKAEKETTIVAVENVCAAKIQEFASEHNVSCEQTTSDLYGCRALCEKDANVLFAKLRIDVRSNCREGTAWLRKTVITFYRQ